MSHSNTEEPGVGADSQKRVVALLLLLTAVTGLVDAFSFLLLGRVFVANMTGNVVFLAFALAGAPGFSIPASLAALAAFAAGAAIGGRLPPAPERLSLLATTVAIEAVLAAVAAAAVALVDPAQATGQYLLIALLAPAMGMQNAAARKLAVPDLTTTVLTLTITGVFVDRPVFGDATPRTLRRAAALGAMFLGALIGAGLVVHSGGPSVLVTATVALGLVGALAMATARRDRSNARPAHGIRETAGGN